MKSEWSKVYDGLQPFTIVYNRLPLFTNVYIRLQSSQEHVGTVTVTVTGEHVGRGDGWARWSEPFELEHAPVTVLNDCRRP